MVCCLPCEPHFMTLPRNRAAPPASLWPARLDLLQSLSGLALALFMWLHMGFVSAILISADFAWAVARFFEGYFFLAASAGVAGDGLRRGDRSCSPACAAGAAQVSRRLAPVPIAARHGSRLRHGDTDAVVRAGGDRLRDVLPRAGASVRHVHASRPDRPLRVRRPRRDRRLLAAVSRIAVRRRGAWQRGPVPVGGEVGLVRGPRRACDAAPAEAGDVGPDRLPAHLG